MSVRFNTASPGTLSLYPLRLELFGVPSFGLWYVLRALQQRVQLLLTRPDPSPRVPNSRPVCAISGTCESPANGKLGAPCVYYVLVHRARSVGVESASCNRTSASSDDHDGRESEGLTCGVNRSSVARRAPCTWSVVRVSRKSFRTGGERCSDSPGNCAEQLESLRCLDRCL